MNLSRRGALALPAGAVALVTLTLAAQALAATPAPATAAHRPAAGSTGWRLIKTVSSRGNLVLLASIDAVSADDGVQDRGAALEWRGLAAAANTARAVKTSDLVHDLGPQ